MKLTLNITEDHIKLFKWLTFERTSDRYFALDTYVPWGGTYTYEDVANILGYQDKILPETLESCLGPRYEEEYQQKMEEYITFILDNFVHVEEIIHQFCDQGGVKPGKYTCLGTVRKWQYNAPKD